MVEIIIMWDPCLKEQTQSASETTVQNDFHLVVDTVFSDVLKPTMKKRRE
jgi:hypothetical protein